MKFRSIAFVLICIGIISIIIVGYYLLIIKNFGYVEGPDIFGDMFGALNVVFTGAVLMLSVYTIYKSSTEGREQLKKQEIEMILNRIDKIHDDFNEENYVTNFIKECRYTEERYALQKKDYELNYYPKEDRWNTSQRIHDIVKSDISNLLTNKYNNYFEYMKLILYLNEKINGLIIFKCMRD